LHVLLVEVANVYFAASHCLTLSCFDEIDLRRIIAKKLPESALSIAGICVMLP